MPRKPRLERANGSYHLINRGNYRQDIFCDDRTKAAFLKCVDETCVSTGWRMFALCVMINHFHLAALTPQPNLARGMTWLLGTFGMRFNRLRGEHGHLFQGRYKSKLLDPEKRLGPTCHYINLNPVRAGIVTVDELADYPWTSVRWLMHPKERPSWFEPRAALEHAGNLQDTAVGRRGYLEYLRWLTDDKSMQREFRFDEMERGWVDGEGEFLKEIVHAYSWAGTNGERSREDLRAAQEALWDGALELLLKESNRLRAELRDSEKYADWKVAIAAVLKAHTTATNRWLGANLHLGGYWETSRRLSACMRILDSNLSRLIAVVRKPQDLAP